MAKKKRIKLNDQQLMLMLLIMFQTSTVNYVTTYLTTLWNDCMTVGLITLTNSLIFGN